MDWLINVYADYPVLIWLAVAALFLVAAEGAVLRVRSA